MIDNVPGLEFATDILPKDRFISKVQILICVALPTTSRTLELTEPLLGIVGASNRGLLISIRLLKET
jgi:hypothetical protein